MIDLLEDMRISKTVNVVDLYEFLEDVPLNLYPSSRRSFFEEGETDEGQNRDSKI